MIDTLRDKRTLIAMVGIPILLYPLLIIGASQGIAIQQTRVKEKDSQVAIGEGTAALLREWIESIDRVRIVESEDPGRDLQEGAIDAVVDSEEDLPTVLAGLGTGHIVVQFDGTELESREAMTRINRFLNDHATHILEDRLAQAGLTKAFNAPLEIEVRNVASARKKAGSVLGSVLPLIMIVMLGVGAFYPAVDLTAGEKERGTFETLLSTPTSKIEIVGGKFLTVVCISLITGMLNLGSMVVSLAFVLRQQAVTAGEAGGRFDLSFLHLDPFNVALIFLTLIPLSFFICAVMMSVAVFARDFKEGQNFMTPFLILIVIPGLFAVMPGTELSRTTIFIPIANVAILFKDLLTEKSSVEAVFLVLLSTGAYAMLAITVAAWLFQREEVILSEEKGIPLALRRSAFTPRSCLTPGASLILFGAALLLLFYVGTHVQSRNFITGMLITQWGLLLVPALFVPWYIRVDMKAAFRLARPAFGAVPATVFVGAGLIILLIHYSAWQQRFLPMPDAMIKGWEQLFRFDGSTRGLVVLLLAAAASPAVCEELLFRGAILSGIRSRMSQRVSILLVGVLFGLFHMSIHRFVPTALAGMVITYAVLRSGSLYVGILLHFFVNAMMVLLATEQWPGAVMHYLEEARVEQEGFPLWVVAAALAVFGMGLVLFELTGRRTGPLRSGQP